jgi:type II secretory ATPase GspE/PulE/Tfp pilus assembly ATPase PilB-like protein
MEKLGNSPETLESCRDEINDITSLQVTYRGKGCRHCHDSGYLGRTALYEIMPDKKIVQEIITGNPSLNELRARLKSQGHRSLRQSALIKVSEGILTLEDALRCTGV